MKRKKREKEGSEGGESYRQVGRIERVLVTVSRTAILPYLDDE
ncbi:hypothetical protein T11_17023 [Trichinella zimbabwensis]|uniref:Uncharacterized protein n=1 Tax=Trichinella zimbabwensis TaxID=268475 RepID=A0A0V1GLZ5_9BILA|nr:hypothetical protein T11_17023 [Trichinella zimbabwensis]